jgi:hypothetical protein
MVLEIHRQKKKNKKKTRERVKGDEHDQSISYPCMKIG